MIRQLVAIASAWGLSTVCAAQPAVKAPAQTGSCVITGGTNSGTITQNCVINPAPPPIILMTNQFETAQDTRGGFNHDIKVRLTITADLVLIACGDDVADVVARPWPAGMLYEQPSIRTGDCVQRIYQNLAAGKWIIRVNTVNAESKFTLSPYLQ